MCFKIAQSLAERERDRQKCDSSSQGESCRLATIAKGRSDVFRRPSAYARAIAAAPIHTRRFWVLAQVRHAGQNNQDQMRRAWSLANIAISLWRARARRDITVPIGTLVTSAISR